MGDGPLGLQNTTRRLFRFFVPVLGSRSSRSPAISPAAGVMVSLAVLTAAPAPVVGEDVAAEDKARTGAVPAAGAVNAFSHDTVVAKAQALAQRPFAPVSAARPPDGKRLDYDLYRAIWFNTDRAIWKDDPSGFELHLFPTGWLYEHPVVLNVVEKGAVRRIRGTRDDFHVGPQSAAIAQVMPWALSGFRINGPLNSPGVSDEIAVFQGASYFRGLSKGQQYGLSARGLALGVASPRGEEFPTFKEFWVEKSADGGASLIVHALLDSPSVAGAYRFVIRPGAPTSMDVTATLFPRVALRDVGIAPLTSMNLLGTLNPQRVADFRPRIHDSDGLAIVNGNGERLWRPLNNPRRLQTSWFVDNNPRGFGLAQRERDYRAYLDLQARYERRPSAWITPIGAWGRGSVVLVEIPSEEEIHDNIVAYWRPETPLAAGRAHTFQYRLDWPNRITTAAERDAPFVLRSRVGPAFGAQGRAGKKQFVIDYAGFEIADGMPLPKANVTVSAGEVKYVVVQAISGTAHQTQRSLDPSEPTRKRGGFEPARAAEATPPDGTFRVAFQFDPGGATTAEFRLQIDGPKGAETWLYRWTQDK